ncbi:SDR family NAD(P)-dependent oxidoreductase, partial [uncultured Chryseobacterium sp.]
FMGFPLHSIYHATKFGIEGWSESMSFELGLHQIGIKTIAPGATLTSFLDRSLEKGLHPAYQDLEEKLLGSTDAMMSNSIAPEQVAAVVYQAATDGKDQIRYLVGEDTKAMDANRLKMGREDFRKELKKQFL